MNTFYLSVAGWVVVTVAFGLAAWLLDVPRHWILVGVLALIGIAIIVSAKRIHSGPS